MRIYIVEDDLAIINILEDIIETQDLGEVCGDCGGEPADILDVLRCKPDVVLVDFFMPVMDGVEFVKELRSVNDKIKIYVVHFITSFNIFNALICTHCGVCDSADLVCVTDKISLGHKLN